MLCFQNTFACRDPLGGVCVARTERENRLSGKFQTFDNKMVIKSLPALEVSKKGMFMVDEVPYTPQLLSRLPRSQSCWAALVTCWAAALEGSSEGHRRWAKGQIPFQHSLVPPGVPHPTPQTMHTASHRILVLPSSNLPAPGGGETSTDPDCFSEWLSPPREPCGGGSS